jgi:hypothetical protein
MIRFALAHLCNKQDGKRLRIITSSDTARFLAAHMEQGTYRNCPTKRFRITQSRNTPENRNR